MSRTLHYPHQPDCIHAESAFGNYETLCSFDPNQSMEVAPEAVHHKRRKRVTCADCQRIIQAARHYQVSSSTSVGPEGYGCE